MGGYGDVLSGMIIPFFRRKRNVSKDPYPLRAKGTLRDNPKEHIDNTEEGSGASGQEGKVAFSPLSSLHSASVAARRGEKNRK